MPNFSGKLHLGRLVGIVRWDDNIDLKDTIFIARIIRAFNIGLPLPIVLVYELDLNVILALPSSQVLVFFLDSLIGHKL